MFNSNRRHTEALEKSARALKRLAAAEEIIARNIGEILRDDDDSPTTPPPLPKQGAMPTKTRPKKK